MAVIDHAFAVRAAQWPEVLAALFDRAARRAERLVVMQAIAHLTRVDDRLLALLWSLAERWGRVVPGGVLVSLRLSHRTLAGMVGARRPSVTTALGQLMARGDIERRADGEWILRGDPPEAAPTSHRRARAVRAQGPRLARLLPGRPGPGGYSASRSPSASSASRPDRSARAASSRWACGEVLRAADRQRADEPAARRAGRR